eukprot:9172181-Ditylum_brightwellii.AAC.2
MPESFYITYMTTRLIAVNKKDPGTLGAGELMECHPINTGNTWHRVFTKAYFEPLVETFIKYTKPCKYGCGESGGSTELSFDVKAMLDGARGTMVASVDVANGYNEIMCKAILEVV